MKKTISLMMMILIMMSMGLTGFCDDVPYDGYTYDYWGEAVPAPEAFVPESSISGDALGIGAFNQPSDIFVSDTSIYIVDTGNNRIVVLDYDWQVVDIIDTFSNEGIMDTFLNPTGIFVSRENLIYVADRDNGRVVVLDMDYNVVFELKNPTSESFSSGFEFIPEKVAVDYAGRIFVIGNGVFEGIMSFDDSGAFFGYQGTIKVSVSPADIIWRALSTKAQREKQVLFIPTEFTNLDMDQDGFIYTTNVDLESDENIKRLNPSGKDVLKRPETSDVDGDTFYLPVSMSYGGPSKFVDIEVRSDGIYSVLDSRRGRIFTYSHEGDLMYVFGTLGNQVGSFKKPVAIESLGDTLLVLDQERGEITSFLPTDYGSLIDQAIRYRYQGNEAASVDLWYEVIQLNSNLELAYVGIGKSLLAQGENKEAMEYFKLGMDQEYYSIAYKRYRNAFLKRNLGPILTAISVLVIVFVTAKVIKKRKGLSVYE